MVLLQPVDSLMGNVQTEWWLCQRRQTFDAYNWMMITFLGVSYCCYHVLEVPSSLSAVHTDLGAVHSIDS
jgi:hypothetical protein